eukprot:2284469-Rhodomonas_salina.1
MAACRTWQLARLVPRAARPCCCQRGRWRTHEGTAAGHGRIPPINGSMSAVSGKLAPIDDSMAAINSSAGPTNASVAPVHGISAPLNASVEGGGPWKRRERVRARHRASARRKGEFATSQEEGWEVRRCKVEV